MYTFAKEYFGTTVQLKKKLKWGQSYMIFFLQLKTLSELKKFCIVDTIFC